MTVSVGVGRLKARFLGGTPRAGDGLPRAQVPSGPELDLLPASPTKFFHKDLDASIEFDLDGEGRPTGFVMRQLGSEARAERVD